MVCLLIETLDKALQEGNDSGATTFLVVYKMEFDVVQLTNYKPRQYCWDTCNVVMLIAAPSPPYNVESPQFRYPLLQSPNIVGGEGGRIGWQGIVQALCQSEYYFIMLKLCSVWSKQQANFPHLSQQVLAKIVFKITLRKSKNICFLL